MPSIPKSAWSSNLCPIQVNRRGERSQPDAFKSRTKLPMRAAKAITSASTVHHLLARLVFPGVRRDAENLRFVRTPGVKKRILVLDGTWLQQISQRYRNQAGMTSSIPIETSARRCSRSAEGTNNEQP